MLAPLPIHCCSQSSWKSTWSLSIQNTSPSRSGCTKCDYKQRNESGLVTIPSELSAGRLGITKRGPYQVDPESPAM